MWRNGVWTVKKLTSCDMRPLRIVRPPHPRPGGAGGSSAGSGCACGIIWMPNITYQRPTDFLRAFYAQIIASVENHIRRVGYKNIFSRSSTEYVFFFQTGISRVKIRLGVLEGCSIGYETERWSQIPGCITSLKTTWLCSSALTKPLRFFLTVLPV